MDIPDAANKTDSFSTILGAIWDRRAKTLPIVALAIHDANHGVVLAQAGAKTIADIEIGVAISGLFGPDGVFASVFSRFEEEGKRRDGLKRVTYEMWYGPYHVSIPLAQQSPYILTIVYHGEPNLGQQVSTEEMICRDLQKVAGAVRSSPAITIS